jgi:predicted DNA-binding transcriptional regulator YafY
LADKPDIRERAVVIDYTNHRGDRAERFIDPQEFFFGSDEWHREPQWLVRAWDLEKIAERTFAMAGVHSWMTIRAWQKAREARDEEARSIADQYKLNVGQVKEFLERWRRVHPMLGL